MAKAREIMTPDAVCVGENDSILDAAKQMAKLSIGAMPICGEDQRLRGMLTDRDIVIKVLAAGLDPATTRAGELGQGKPVTIGADDNHDEILATMTEHKVWRLPVIDGHDLVGMVAQGDLAEHLSPQELGELVQAVQGTN